MIQFVDESIIFSSPRSIKNLNFSPREVDLNISELKKKLSGCQKISEEDYDEQSSKFNTRRTYGFNNI